MSGIPSLQYKHSNGHMATNDGQGVRITACSRITLNDARFQILYTFNGDVRGYKARIAAQYSGIPLIVAESETFQMGVTNRSEDYLRKFPTGKVTAELPTSTCARPLPFRYQPTRMMLACISSNRLPLHTIVSSRDGFAGPSVTLLFVSVQRTTPWGEPG